MPAPLLRCPPRRRVLRPQQERRRWLEHLLPIPDEPAISWLLVEDAAERKRLCAVEKVRRNIESHVYAACDPENWRWSYDDPYDPIIDYPQLKFRYQCFAFVHLADDDDNAEMEMAINLPGLPYTLWATLDGRRALLMVQDRLAQEWQARGGDPPPQPVPAVSNWIDVDSEDEE